MEKVFTAYGSLGQDEREPEKKKFNWSDTGFALGTFAGTTGVGLVALGMAGVETSKAMIASALPGAGAGIIAYFLRKKCPPCQIPVVETPSIEIPSTRPPRLTRQPEQRQQGPVIGLGAIPTETRVSMPGSTVQQESMAQINLTRQPEVRDDWVTESSNLLRTIGYDVPVQDTTNQAWHDAVADFQTRQGLQPTGWIDAETASRLVDEASSRTGEEVMIPTITPQGVGVEAHNQPAKKKSRWAWYVAGFGVAGLAVAGVIAGVVSKEK